MKVKFENSVLTVTTGIKEETVKKGIASLEVRNPKDKNDVLFAVNQGDKAGISRFGLTCNAVVDGELAIIIVTPPATKLEDVQKTYGQALVSAKRYLEAINMTAVEAEEAIAEIFE